MGLSARESIDCSNIIDGSGRHGYSMTPKKRSGLVGAIAPVLVSIMLASSCRTCRGERQIKHRQPELQLDQEGEIMTSSTNLPRILTVLTTYNQRTQYVKAYREVAANRTDGYKPMIFVTSDEEDADPDGVIDYKFGKPRVHRLLAALREAISRYSGQFDWIAVGDDDTIFMYKRAIALLRHIDHTQAEYHTTYYAKQYLPHAFVAALRMDDISQPVAIGMVHGFCGVHGVKRGLCQCFSPEERSGESATPKAVNGCCLDITQPCEVPINPDPDMSDSSMKKIIRGVRSYHGNLYWPYGGTGFFISAALAETIQANGDGWEVCREMFGRDNTDVQVARCLVANGLTMSSLNAGFYRPDTADVEKIRDYISLECQDNEAVQINMEAFSLRPVPDARRLKIIGVHAGFRHLEDGSEYTTDEFKATLSTVWVEDDAQSWLTDGSLESECPQTWAAVSRWK